MSTMYLKTPTSNSYFNRTAFVLGAACILIGATALVHSSSLPVYKDAKRYQTEYQAIDPQAAQEAATQQYFELRNRELTSKFQLQDYGATTIAIGSLLILFGLVGGLELRSPRSKFTLAALGILAAVLTSAASLFHLFLAFQREEFPWWGDSLGIPLGTQEFPLFLILLFVALSHLFFLRGNFQANQHLLNLQNLRRHPWFVFIGVFTIISLIEALVRAEFAIVIPLALWLYYFLSLAAGFARAQKT